MKSIAEFENYEEALDAAMQTGSLSNEDKRLLKHEDFGVRLLVIKAALGDSESQFVLGCFYDKGVKELNIPRSDDDFFKWLEKASEQGNRDAKTRLGCTYINSGIIGYDHSSRKRGIDLLEEAAAMGDSQAKRLLSEYRSSRNSAVAKGCASGCFGYTLATITLVVGGICGIISLI